MEILCTQDIPGLVALTDMIHVTTDSILTDFPDIIFSQKTVNCTKSDS